MTKVAVLGLGIMGGGLARNLIRKGFVVTVWNRSPARAEPFRAAGATVADNPSAAAAEADVVIDVVTDAAASRETWTGRSGALIAMRKGTVAVECATLSVAWIRELHGLAGERGIAFVDSPMTGSRVAAEEGTLTLLVGAAPEDLERARPVLEAFSRRIFHFGRPGAGTAYKLVNNMILAAQVLGAGEGIALAQSAGLDLQLVSQAMLEGAMASPIVKAKLPAIVRREHADTQFALRWMLKDLRYALELARELGISLPDAETVCRLYTAAEERGWGGLDFSGVTEVCRSEAGN
jgi:3-hydroxyisobutyrate dehydrogenase